MNAFDIYACASPPAAAGAVSPAAHDTLKRLPWFPFDVATSVGSVRAAARIARGAERAYWLLRQVLDFTPSVRLRVLDRAAWAACAATAPFGVAHIDGNGDLIVGAEAADAWLTISAWLAEELDRRTLRALVRVHGEDPRTGGPLLDAVAESLVVHELAHLIGDQAEVRFPRRWLAEAFANYAMVAVLGETDPVGLRRLGSLAQAAETLDTRLPSLAQFEAEFGDLDAIASVLAQLTLTRGVYETYATAQAAPLARLFHLFRAGATAARTASGGSLPDADFELGRLLSTHAHPTLACVAHLFPAARLRAAA